MQYHLRSRPNKFSHWKTIVAFILFFILLSISYLFPNASKSAVFAVSKPLWFISDKVKKPFILVKGFFTSKNSLVSQNLDLQNQIASLQLKQIDYDNVLNENFSLKNQFGTTTTRIVSRVLSKPPRSPYDTFVIDLGSYDGITLGSKVYLSDTIIIGLVTTVTSHNSLVTLFSASGQKQEVTDARTGESFEILGKGGANFSVEVPKDADILWGDTFLYPTKSTSIVGNVYYIDTNSQSSFKTVYLRVPTSVFQSQRVLIEK